MRRRAPVDYKRFSGNACHAVIRHPEASFAVFRPHQRCPDAFFAHRFGHLVRPWVAVEMEAEVKCVPPRLQPAETAKPALRVRLGGVVVAAMRKRYLRSVEPFTHLWTSLGVRRRYVDGVEAGIGNVEIPRSVRGIDRPPVFQREFMNSIRRGMTTTRHHQRKSWNGNFSNIHVQDSANYLSTSTNPGVHGL